MTDAPVAPAAVPAAPNEGNAQSAPSWQPIGMPVTPVEYNHPAAIEARAKIDQLKGNPDFYKQLHAEKDRGLSGAARQEWDRLHKVGYPVPTEITSQQDVDSQNAARNNEQLNGYVAFIKNDVPGLTEVQEAELRAGVTNQISRDWAVREKEIMIRSSDFRRKLLDGSRAEREAWAKVNAILAMRVVK